jgi:large subunit ribosomal protein L30
MAQSMNRVKQLVEASGIRNALSYPRLTTPLEPTKTQKLAASFRQSFNPAARVLAITLVKSGTHQRPHVRYTLESIGLRRIHQTVYQKNLPSVRGKLNTVKHLVNFKTID